MKNGAFLVEAHRFLFGEDWDRKGKYCEKNGDNMTIICIFAIQSNLNNHAL